MIHAGFTTDIFSSSTPKSPSDHPPCHNIPAQDLEFLPKHSTDSGDAGQVHVLGVSDLTLLTTVLGGYASKWNLIGIALGFTPQEISNIRSKQSLSETAPKSYLVELLNEWLHCSKEVHKVEPTLEALETALKSQFVGLGVVSETLRCQILQRKASGQLIHKPIANPLPDCVQKYAEFLQSKYRYALPLMPPGEWPPNRGRQYSDLTIVEKVSDSLPDQESVDARIKALSQGQVNKVSENERVIKSLDDVLAQASNEPLKVLVEGIPGVGKSTLIRKSCKDWADGQSLQQFDLVLLIPLRKQEIRQAKHVKELLESDDPDLRKEVVKHLQKTYGEGVLFIFDGYDELNEEEQPFFRKLIQGELLHKCSIVLTSRSYAVEDLKYEEWIHHHVEILGFTEQQMESYFLQNITDESEANTLATSLREETSLSSISYTPLNCSILLYTFRQRRGKLPSTLTELFEVFVISLLKRHSKKFIGNFAFKTLQSLPQPLKNQCSTLCELAYNGILQGKFLFSPEDVVEAFQVQESSIGDIEACLLSLMVSATSFGSVSEESHYQFVHMTVQEFLAAKWIADQPEDKQKKFLQLNWRSARMKTVLVFYAGITNLQGPHIDEFFENVNSDKYLDSILLHSLTLPSHRPSAQPRGRTSYLKGLGDSFTQPLRPREDLFAGVTTLVRDISLTQPFRPMEDLSIGPTDSLLRHTAVFESIAEVPRKPYSYKQLHQRFPINPSVAVQAFLNIVSMLVETKANILQDSAIFKKRHIQCIRIGYHRLTTFDSSALAKFLSNCPCPLDSLHFNFCNLTSQSLKIFHKISTNGCCCLKQCNEVQLNYCAPSFSSALSLLPQIPWFHHTKVLCLNGLQYLKDLHPEDFHLHVLLSMKNLTNLTVSVEQLLKKHLQDYEKVFFKFVKALEKNNTLQSFTYYQSPSAATCESFVQLMSALSHNTNVSLEIGHTKVITSDSVTITDDICFEICSSGLTSAMKLAVARGIKKLQVHCLNLVLVCNSCQSSMGLKPNFLENCDQSDETVPATFNHSVEVADRLLGLFHGTSNTGPTQYTEVCIEFCTPSLSSMLFLFPQIPWFQQTKVLCLHGLQYPKGLCPDTFQLHILSTMENVRHLEVTIKEIPENHLVDYEAVFLKFVDALQKNTTLESLSYYQIPSAATCEPFVQLMTALSHNTRVKLGIGLTQVVTVDSVTIPIDICFKVCSRGLASIMELADKRGIKSLYFHQHNLFLPHKDCLTSLKPCDNTSYSRKLPIDNLPLAESDHHDVEDPAMLITTFLTKNETLLSLDISGYQVTDEVAQSIAAGLAENGTLKEIKLNSDHLTSKGAGHILQSLNQTKITKLSFIGVVCEISYNSYCLTMSSGSSMLGTVLDVSILEEIFKDTVVEELVMHMWKSDVALKFLERLLTADCTQTLKRLHLNYCTLDDAAATHIATGLAKNQSLKILKLSYSFNLTNTGAVDIFKSLENNSTLEEVDISWMVLPDQQPSVNYNCESLGCAVEKILTVSQTLRRLDLRTCECNDEVAAHIATGLSKNHSLKMLNLSSNCNMSSAGAVKIFKSLESNTSLAELNLSGNILRPHKASIKSEDESLGYALEKLLTVSKTLTRLDLICCALSDTGAEYIAAGIATNYSLKVLNLSSNYIISAGAVDIFKSLESNTSLEELDLSRNMLQTLSTSSNSDDESMGHAVEEMLTDNHTLRRLDLGFCYLDDLTAAHIATGLAQNDSLRTLNLSGNNITSGGADIFKSLESNASLEELDLSWNQFRYQSLGCVVEKVLISNQILRRLDLSSCWLHNVVATHVANGLAKNQSLKILNLSSSYNITRAGAVDIFKSLEINNSLEELYISGIRIKSEDESLGCAVERMLTVNQTLRRLDLIGCGLNSNEATPHIATGLAKNYSLKVLNLS